MIEEDTVETGLQDVNQEKGAVEGPPQIREKAAKVTENNKGERAVRHSERIKKQNMGGMKIADKADMAARKRNLEGNTFIHKNSFALVP